MRIAPLVSVALVAMACSPGEEVAGTTTTTVSTTATPDTTSSTTASTTTTTQPSTTTTQSTTTTEALLAGNWSDMPLVTSGFGALGWWDGASWVRAEDEGALPVVGGEDYQVVAVGVEAIINGGPQTLVCEPLDLIGVVLEAEELLGEWPGPYGVAISAPWQIQPHLFEPVSDDGTYGGFARVLLSERGLDVANPKIKQLFRTDLEGDGVNEVLVVAEDIQGGYLPNEGDYSIAFLRKVVQGDVRTAILGASVLTDSETYPASFRIGGVADLSGDGKMEIVVSSAYFEGLGVEVWEYVDDDFGPTPQIQVGCGS